jgi:hypothetical protein
MGTIPMNCPKCAKCPNHPECKLGGNKTQSRIERAAIPAEIGDFGFDVRIPMRSTRNLGIRRGTRFDTPRF